MSHRQFYAAVSPRPHGAVTWTAHRLSVAQTSADLLGEPGTVSTAYRRLNGDLIVVVAGKSPDQRRPDGYRVVRISAAMSDIPKFTPAHGDALSILFPEGCGQDDDQRRHWETMKDYTDNPPLVKPGQGRTLSSLYDSMDAIVVTVVFVVFILLIFGVSSWLRN